MNGSILIFRRGDLLREKDILTAVEMIETIAREKDFSVHIYPEIPESIDLVVSIGGDGTFLDASHIAIEHDVPMVGVNGGSLGFLTEVKMDEIDDIREILDGDHSVQERIVTRVVLERCGIPCMSSLAVNESVLTRNHDAGMLEFTVRYDGNNLSSYKADGVIIATPTGSTAYNLSLNGPILFPSSHSMVINAMAPHALTHRPIVIPSNRKIEVLVGGKSRGNLTIDGRRSFRIQEGDRVVIEEASRVLKVIPSKRRTFFDILSEKLHFGRRD